MISRVVDRPTFSRCTTAWCVPKGEPPFSSKIVSEINNHIILVKYYPLMFESVMLSRGACIRSLNPNHDVEEFLSYRLTSTLHEMYIISKSSISTMSNALLTIKDPTRAYHTVSTTPPRKGQEKWYAVM